MKTYFIVVVICLMAATANAQSLADFVGDWTYTRGTISVYTPDGTLIDQEPMAGKSYTFKKRGNRIVTFPQGSPSGTNVVHKLSGSELVIAGKQSKCLNTSDGYCCSHHITSSYTLNGEQLFADIEFGMSCDGVILQAVKVTGVLTKE